MIYKVCKNCVYLSGGYPLGSSVKTAYYCTRLYVSFTEIRVNPIIFSCMEFKDKHFEYGENHE